MSTDDRATDLSAARISQALERRGYAGIGRPLELVAETVSTNDDARRAAAEGAPHGATIIADRQTRGRGRGDRRWHSPPGENLHLSTVLRLDLPLDALAPLSLAAGVAVARCCDEVLGESPVATVKWPNDVYLAGRKVAGTLIETTSRGGKTPAVVLGVGLNLLGRSWPSDFTVPATSLLVAGGDPRACERNDVAGRLLHHLGQVVGAYAEKGLSAVLAELRQRDFLAGRHVRVDGREGVAEGIDDRGRLSLRGEDGALTPVVSGEVVWSET